MGVVCSKMVNYELFASPNVLRKNSSIIFRNLNCNLQLIFVDYFDVKPSFWSALMAALKVRQIRNDFFKPTFLPKNEQTNSTLLLVDLFSFVFWKKVKTPKKCFEINWPLAIGLTVLIYILWTICTLHTGPGLGSGIRVKKVK